MTAYLDLHVLQSVPPSNVNRDETGSPKTAVYGGVRRARVSSQSWKRAMRLTFRDLLDDSELGVRSKRLVDMIAHEISAIAPELNDKAEKLAVGVLGATGIKIEKPKRGAKHDADEGEASAESGYLIFLSNLQVHNLAAYAVEVERSGATPIKKEVVALAKKDHSFDIALFGRMVADLTDLNVDAAAQVAHAISVHGVENEFDYFTAVDDHSTDEHAGAGMIGTVEYNSSTLYRYATVNLDRLSEHLGDAQAVRRAVRALVEAFIRSMPTGKQNTFAHRTLPQAVVVSLRSDQPVNLVGAFEEPVEVDSLRGGLSRLAQASAALVEHSVTVSDAFDAPADRTWVLAAHKDAAVLGQLGESVSLGVLLDQVSDVAAETLGESV